MDELPKSGNTEQAEAMDTMYRYQRHIYDLTRKYYLLGRDHLVDTLDAPTDCSVLEVACGTGRNLKYIARRYPSAKLYGLDISEKMLESARTAFSKTHHTPVFITGDACQFQPNDLGVSGFDRIVISYALSMIPDWPKAIERALAALLPGGSLHIIDFGLQEELPRWFHIFLHLWLKKFHVTPRSNLDEILNAQAKAFNATLKLEAIGRGYARHAILTHNLE